MTPTVTVLASGLKLLLFQGVTTFQGRIIVATVEGELLRIGQDGSVTVWASVEKFGIPTGIAGSQKNLIVAVSAQESGHFLLQVSPQGAVSIVADLSALAGEFGAPFAVAVRDGYYPAYWVAISTDVVRSGGVIAQVTGSGRTSIVATLPLSPFGIGLGADGAIATQENGPIIRIDGFGQPQVLADLSATKWGSPLSLTPLADDWLLTTTAGWLLALKPDGTLAPILNLAAQGLGAPTTLTTVDHQLAIATQSGNLLLVSLT